MKKWIPLILLSLAGFTFNTSELMPIGLLSDIAASLDVSEARAGLLISIYAWMVALLSLPLMLWCASMNLRRLMMWVVAVFFVSHIGSVLATGYWTLLASRIGVACAHSIFWSIAPPMAVRVAPGHNRSAGISALMAGGGVALVAGLPLGRVLGLVAGWRASFAVLGLLAGIILLCFRRAFPDIGSESEGGSRGHIMHSILHCRPLLMLYLIVAVMVLGHYTGYSYIEPYMDQVARMPAQAVTATLCVFGVAGLLGSGLMARWYRPYRRRIITAICVCIPLMLVALLPLTHMSVWLLVPVCLVWGVAVTAFNIAFQNELVELMPHATAVAMSIYSGIFNLGIGTGALAGGFVTDAGHLAHIGYTGGAIAFFAAVYALMRYMPERKRMGATR